MTYMDCDNTADTSLETVVPLSVIDNPSAKFFEYASIDTNTNVDGDGDNLVDGTEYACDLDGDPANGDEATCGTTMDHDYGWTCRDLAATEADGNAWVKCEGAVNEGYVYCSI